MTAEERDELFTRALRGLEMVKHYLKKHGIEDKDLFMAYLEVERVCVLLVRSFLS